MELKNFIIGKSAFALGVSAENWQAAVKTGTDLLCRAGAAEERYYDAILEMTAKNGPYYVIAPRIAMPHIPPEMGGTATGIALVTLAEPVSFEHKNNDSVHLCGKYY